MSKRTFTLAKVDVGSIGGHTQPTPEMLDAVRSVIASEVIDYRVGYTGDDINVVSTHDKGPDSPDIHNLMWKAFEAATKIAEDQGLYGAGQDLLADAPSGNLRGKGPGIAEVLIGPSKTRKAEALIVFTADKTGPGAFNFPLYSAFVEARSSVGLMMPKFIKGFTFTIIDMSHLGGERVIHLNTPDQYMYIQFLLRDVNRFAVQAIHTRHDNDQVVSATTDRLHNISGTYTGKDDPGAIVRVQSAFLAPEEVTNPYTFAHIVPGGARGSKYKPFMPVALNTAVTGADCLPIVSCAGYSVKYSGALVGPVDFFGNVAWDETRLLAQRIARYMAPFHPFMPTTLEAGELEYADYAKTLEFLETQFTVNK